MDSLSCLSQQLKYEFTTLCIDLFGFGGSKHPPYPLTIADYALAVVSIINELQFNNIVLVGHSFGGRVALYISAHFSFLVDKLILIDSAGLLPKKGIKHLARRVSYKFRKAFKLPIDCCGSPDYRALSGDLKRTFVNVVNYNQYAMLDNISCKTLIIWGKLDKETPLYMAKTLHKKIKNSRLCIYETAGHFAYIDCFSEVVLKIKSFLGGEYD